MRIVITGDSWGYVWNPDKQHNFNNSEPGIQRFLEQQGHTVTNVATSGNSNSQSFRSLYNQTDQDLAIFIQTEPIREWWVDESDPEFPGRRYLDADHVYQLAKQHQGLIPAVKHHLRNEIYDRLAQWSIQHSIPVLLVGGCSSVPNKTVPKSLTVAVGSWSELLFGRKRFQDHMFQNTNGWIQCRYAQLIHRNRDTDLMVEWFDFSQQVLDKIAFWGRDTEYFNPDKWHPNLLGHQRLAEALEPIIQRYR